jgi:hypothetical protein
LTTHTRCDSINITNEDMEMIKTTAKFLTLGSLTLAFNLSLAVTIIWVIA